MKPGTIHLNHASLDISYPAIVPNERREFIREISSFNVPEEWRGKGEGTELMNEVCEIADQDAIHLLLIAGDEKLEKYYNRFGFNRLSENGVILMVRIPKSAQLPLPNAERAPEITCQTKKKTLVQKA